ncbi:MAG: hypothetical protein Q4B17_01945 [Lautropia sp.]|nr:hypothetical protein [Lautropia sp.]
MKTMIFSGRTMREAMALAKQRFGGDIDILNSDQVGDEVQVTVVVPEPAGGARRRKAVDRVSAGIKALADGPMKGERIRAPVKGIETADIEAPAVQPAAVATVGVAGEGVDEAAAGRAPGKASRSTRAAKGSKAGTGRTSRKTAGTRGSKPEAARADGQAGRLACDTGDEAEGTHAQRAAGGEAAGTRIQNAGEDEAIEATAAVVPVDAEKDAGGDSGSGRDVQTPLSTLDFERTRRSRAERDRMASSTGDGAAAPVEAPAPAETQGSLPSQASSLAQALAEAQQATAAPIVPLPASVSGDGMSHGMPAVTAGPAVPMTGGGEWRRTGEPREASPEPWHTEPAAEGQALVSGKRTAEKGATSRLSLVLNSARRMLGGAPGRWLSSRSDTASPPVPATSTPVAQVAGVVAGPVDASAGTAAFGQDAPMPLSSLLQSGTSDWPSLSWQTEAAPVPAVGGAPVGESGRGSDGVSPAGAVDGASIQAQGRAQESRLNGVGWFETARRRPAQMRLLRNLLSCQFSPSLARTLVSLLPVDYSDVQSDEWLRRTMLRALAGVNGKAGLLPGHAGQTIFDGGGVFALIGPTGVGKTTSIAKIAAHHVLRHGPKSLALITADVYRIGAQEQLRAFGKMLGVPVQVAQDREVLQSLLKEHEDRRLVLIDTAGISQRDERVTQLTSALSLAQVRRVLVLNAGTQPGGIEDVLRAFGARETVGVLLSKVDEAVGLGACFDALIRHRLPLIGYTDGQRVPEDYHPANLGVLIESALSDEAANRYPSLSMTDSEMRHLFEGSHV